MSQTMDRTPPVPVTRYPTTAEASAAPRQDFGASLSNAVRDNPASAALIGMGVAWLFFGGSKTALFGSKSPSRRHRDHDRDRDDYELRFEPQSAQYRDVDRFGGTSRGAGRYVSEAAGSVGSAARTAGSGVAAGASSVADAAAQGYDAAASYASDAAAYAGNAASYIGASAYDASRAGSRMVRSQAGHAQQTVGEFFEHQPLALGVLGLAVGAGIAALLPATKIEQEYLGETSDALKEQARALAGEKLGQAKDLAATALDEVTREAEAQGLTKASLQDAAADIKDRVANVAATAKSSI